jgi:recombination protein RecT
MANEIMKMPSTGNTIASYLSSDAVRGNIAKVVAEKNADRFVTSIVSAVQANPQLARCTNQSILSAALMGESLQLPPSPQLGYYYMVGYKNKKKIGDQWVEVEEAQFQIGWKGEVQLAIRSGQYKNIVVNEIKEGEIDYNPITEEISLHPIMNPTEREKAKTIGYYAAFELVSGFKKEMFSPIEKIRAHAKQYSKSYRYDLNSGKKSSVWSTNFDAMAKKTMIRMLLSKWGIMSVEMQNAYVNDMAVIDEDGTARYVDNQQESIEDRVHEDISANANSQAFEDAEVIDEEVVNAPHVEERSTHVQQAATPTAQSKRGRPRKSQEPEPATNPAPPEIPKPVDVEEEVPAFVAADDAPEWE